MSMQHIMLEGRLGRDAEIKTTARGNKYVSFTLAVDGRDKDNNKTTTWYNVSSFQENHTGKFAEYLKKGSGLIVMGAPSFGIWTDRNGQAKLDLNVRATNLEFPTLGGGKENGDGQQQSQQQTARQSVNAPAAAPVQAPEPEDDLPF